MTPFPDETPTSHGPAVPWESIDPTESRVPSPEEMALVRSQDKHALALASSDPEVSTISIPASDSVTESATDEPIFEGAATVILEAQDGGDYAVVGEEDGDDTDDSPEDWDETGDGELSGLETATLGYATESPKRDGGGWTISVLCLGLAIIAACVIIPQADANRRLAYEREKLQRDLDQIQKQTALNQQFIGKIQNDPQLAERLAQRQMRMVRDGETVLDLRSAATTAKDDSESGAAAASSGAEKMSPFMIVHVPAPAPLPEYKPVGGALANLCRQPRTDLYLLGAGMFMVATGLVLGDASRA